MSCRCALFTFVLSLLIVAGCSSDGTKPDGESDPTDPYTHEASTSIGAAGGTLAASGFELAVPAGAFGATAELTLASSAEGNPFGEAAVSKVFRVDGVPFDCTAPLQLAIAWEDTLSGESQIAIGEEVFVPSTGVKTLVYHLLDATASSGRLVAEIPAPDIEDEKRLSALSGSSADPMRFYVTGVSRRMSREHAETLFRVFFNPLTVSITDVDYLVDDLAAAWAEMEVMGFDPEPRRTAWPVDVDIRDLEGDAVGRFVPSAWRKDWASFEFDETEISVGDKVKAAASHEVPLFVEYLYAPVHRYEVLLGTESDRLWLDEAVASYVEEYLTSGFAIAYGTLGAPLRGLQAGAASGARDHGRGLTLFVEELRLRPPSASGTWGDVYAQIEQGKGAIQSIAAVYGDLDDWYSDYLEKYVHDRLSWADEDELIRGAWDEFPIASANDTLRSFTRSYPDLSGRIFRIPLSYEGIRETASLNFSTQGRTAGIYILKYARHFLSPELYEASPLISSVDDVSVVNVGDLMEDCVGLLALVTNSRWVSPYTETSDITLTIHLANDPGYNRCAFRVVDFLIEVDSDGKETPSRDQMLFSSFGTGAGSFVGNTFVGTWSEREFGSGDTWSTGTVTVVLSPTKDSVVSMTVEENIDWQSWTSELTFTAGSIPRDMESGYDLDYAVLDEEACERVTGFEYQTLIGYPGGPSTLQSYSCSYRTEVELLFWTEE